MYHAIAVRDWAHLSEIARFLQGWAFRGQEDAALSLSTSFERRASRCGWTPAERKQKEEQILEHFQRRAHHYLVSCPERDDWLEWLALIQHHGGSTRLLDFSRSAYVGAFFAVEDAVQDAALWCVNLDMLHRRVVEALEIRDSGKVTIKSPRERSAAVANMVLKQQLTKKTGRVLPVEPFRLSERMSIQQGLFLMPVVLRKSFERNLIETYGLEPDVFAEAADLDVDIMSEKELAVLKVIIPLVARNEIVSELAKMNITASTLFPGVDGFARSLNNHFVE